MPLKIDEIKKVGPFGGQIFEPSVVKEALDELFENPFVISSWGHYETRWRPGDILWVTQFGIESEPLAIIERGSRRINDAQLGSLLQDTKSKFTRPIRPFFVEEPNAL
tara:strand:- start:85 stop:408 length:324 start_codon:yes stop_codon:yes gene_type:complete